MAVGAAGRLLAASMRAAASARLQTQRREPRQPGRPPNSRPAPHHSSQAPARGFRRQPPPRPPPHPCRRCARPRRRPPPPRPPHPRPPRPARARRQASTPARVSSGATQHRQQQQGRRQQQHTSPRAAPLGSGSALGHSPPPPAAPPPPPPPRPQTPRPRQSPRPARPRPPQPAPAGQQQVVGGTREAGAARAARQLRAAAAAGPQARAGAPAGAPACAPAGARCEPPHPAPPRPAAVPCSCSPRKPPPPLTAAASGWKSVMSLPRATSCAKRSSATGPSSASTSLCRAGSCRGRRCGRVGGRGRAGVSAAGPTQQQPADQALRARRQQRPSRGGVRAQLPTSSSSGSGGGGGRRGRAPCCARSSARPAPRRRRRAARRRAGRRTARGSGPAAPHTPRASPWCAGGTGPRCRCPARSCRPRRPAGQRANGHVSSAHRRRQQAASDSSNEGAQAPATAAQPTPHPPARTLRRLGRS